MTLQERLRQVSKFYIDGRECADGNRHITWADESAQAADRIDALEAALRAFAAIDGVAVPRMKVDPKLDRLWSYYESRSETQYEITRAHIIEAARVLNNKD